MRVNLEYVNVRNIKLRFTFSFSLHFCKKKDFPYLINNFSLSFSSFNVSHCFFSLPNKKKIFFKEKYFLLHTEISELSRPLSPAYAKTGHDCGLYLLLFIKFIECWTWLNTSNNRRNMCSGYSGLNLVQIKRKMASYIVKAGDIKSILVGAGGLILSPLN